MNFAEFWEFGRLGVGKPGMCTGTAETFTWRENIAATFGDKAGHSTPNLLNSQNSGKSLENR